MYDGHSKAGHFEKQTERVVLKCTKHIFSELKIEQEALIRDWTLQTMWY